MIWIRLKIFELTLVWEQLRRSPPARALLMKDLVQLTFVLGCALLISLMAPPMEYLMATIGLAALPYAVTRAAHYARHSFAGGSPRLDSPEGRRWTMEMVHEYCSWAEKFIMFIQMYGFPFALAFILDILFFKGNLPLPSFFEIIVLAFVLSAPTGILNLGILGGIEKKRPDLREIRREAGWQWKDHVRSELARRMPKLQVDPELMR